MIKVDWLAAGVLRSWHWISQCSPDLAYNLRILPANEKQDMVADEIIHNQVTNKKQGNMRMS
jgi:hypothetical protein